MDKRVILAAFLVASMVALVFLPALRNDFIVYDDRTYIVENPDVLEGIGAAPARWAMTTFHAANWHPLTWLSHQLDAEVWGLNPAGHHLTSILLHALAAGLLYIFLILGHRGAPRGPAGGSPVRHPPAPGRVGRPGRPSARTSCRPSSGWPPCWPT